MRSFLVRCSALLWLAGECCVPAATLALDPSNGGITLSLAPADSPPAAIQWTVTYPPGNAISISIAEGTATSAAGKSIQCVSLSNSSTCLISGGTRTLSPGMIAQLAVAGPAAAPVWIANAIAVSANGDGMLVTATGGSPRLESVVCSPPAAGAAASVCEVRLTGPAGRGGMRVAITCNTAYLASPASVEVSEGATAASFEVKAAAAGKPSNGGAVTATLEGLSISAFVSLAGGAPGLIAAYAFDEGQGTRLNDFSGQHDNGTVVGGLWTGLGRRGGALLFDGESAYVDIGDPGGLNAAGATAGSMTWSAWVRPAENPPDDGQIVACSTDNAGWQLKTSPDTGQRTFGVAVSSERGARAQRYGATTVTLGQWYFVAAVYDAALRTLDIYVNGKLDNGILSGAVPGRQGLAHVNASIGKRDGGFYFNGAIDDLRIYNRALSQPEIQADMSAPVAAPPTSLPRLETLSCEPAVISQGETTTCAISLSASAREPAVITVAPVPLLTFPAEITIPAGASAAAFDAYAIIVRPSGRPNPIRPQPKQVQIEASFGPDAVHDTVTVLPGAP